MHNVKN